MQLRTTAAPSPIAAPTRFTEPARTSPTAKIPATLVSIGSGGRPITPALVPVRMNPFSSSGTPQPTSQDARRICAGEDEEVRDGALLLGPAATVTPAHALQPLVGCTGELDDSGLAEDGDVGRGGDPVDQIAGHGARETRPAHDHGHVARLAGEEHRGLSGRVSAPIKATSSPRHSRASAGEAQYQTPRPSNCGRVGISGRR